MYQNNWSRNKWPEKERKEEREEGKVKELIKAGKEARGE
jgi:hypothetical protein